MAVRCTPNRTAGFSASGCMACGAQKQGTIKVVEQTTPSVSERKIAPFVEWHIPKSSAFIVN
jgi:hypothetical protein